MSGLSLAIPDVALYRSGPSVLLSAATVLDTASIGTVVGTLSVINGTGSYTYSLTSNPGGLFSISGSSLEVAASLSGQDGSHAVTVHADNGAGSTANGPFLVTVNPAVGFSLSLFDLSDLRNLLKL